MLLTERQFARHVCFFYYVRISVLNVELFCVQVLEKQWAYHVECEKSPHDWMLGGAAAKMQSTRKKLARYVKARKEDLALVENCTAATTAVVRAVRIRPGDTIIHLSTAYGMVKNCIAQHAASAGATVLELKVDLANNTSLLTSHNFFPLEVRLGLMIDEVQKNCSRVALVSLDYIASCPGVVLPVHALARHCRERKVPVLLDGAHVLGQIQIDCQALEASGVTYMMADAHKWLYAPKGSAMLWVTESAQGNCFPSAIGAVCSNSPTTNFKEEVVYGLSKFERRFQYTGTRDYTPLISICDAIDFREYLCDSAVLGYNHGLTVWAQEWLASLWNTETLVPARYSAFMAHVRVPVRSAKAAMLVSCTLKDECAIHTLSFPLPARTHLCETEPTSWVRPCMQLFLCRADVQYFGLNVLELARKGNAAAKAMGFWQEKMSSRLIFSPTSRVLAHTVTVGFSVSSTNSLRQVNAKPCKKVAGSDATSPVLVAFGKSRAVISTLSDSFSGASIPALKEEEEVPFLQNDESFEDPARKYSDSHDFVDDFYDRKRNLYLAKSPVSVFDVGNFTSVKS